MQQDGVISSKDIETIQSYLGSEETYAALAGKSLENGKSPSEALMAYLDKAPLSDAQLSGYRTSLVASADNYLKTPAQKIKQRLRRSYTIICMFLKQEQVLSKKQPTDDCPVLYKVQNRT